MAQPAESLCTTNFLSDLCIEAEEMAKKATNRLNVGAQLHFNS